MTSSQNIELEAAKFLHKLIQDSKDEPAQLATKLYVILQHMKTSGKEHSMPYQVISRAMETVVNQNGLDIEALKSSRLPHAGGTQMEDSGSAHLAGSSQVVGVSNESKASLVDNEMSKYDAFTSGRQLGGSNSASQAVYLGSGTRSNRSFEHESPSSLDSKSGNSQSHDRSETMNQRDVKSSAKRKRGESSFSWEQNMDNSQLFDTHGPVDDQTRKMSKVEMPVTGDIENLHVGLSSDAYTTPQGGWQNSEVTAIRPPAHRDTGKSVAAEDILPSGPLFKEQQLKQLRAQCLVFLALRNGLMPKKLHIDIALGNIFPKDDGFRRELFDQKGRTHSLSESGSIHEVSAPSARMDNPTERLAEMDFSSKETEMPRLEEKISNAVFPDGQKLLLASKTPDAQAQNQVSGSHSELASSSGGPIKHAPAEIVGWAGIINRNDISTSTSPLDEFCAPDQEEGNMQPSPKYTMSQKWIMDRQNKRLLVDRSWGLKQHKADQAIGARFNELKQSVSSSEDISTKTKSVIELKKLQLLNLQRRLRSEFLYNFFKPIATDVENLKSYKKHKHGRRIKQLEKYEQRMKEERQRRIRERQKEFFGEIEVHKERLEDLFKARRERWKGFNRYVKEFHKRKERIHREKIDKIQREKINLLKINDVEGYLRMVQDAKSDRVKQLLKETEKYLQKLGSKLKEAKSLTSRFGNEADETHTSIAVEDETSVENEDESDQAKHYLESNEKYYLMAHSIKENINEQPSSLKGGKLREYQLNGLRWLLSLYNNHLNGILADEMGLGKTVQVISLICYLMETKNDRGPFLVVVPSSVLPGWVSEINFWAPTIQKIVYSGPPEERRKLFKEQIVHQKFNVLLTTYEYLMNKHDRPKLSKILWHYIIIDEGHRIKNASCKLNADLKHYNSSHRLLLTGTPLQNNLEELWALLNFLLPNIFNSSEDFSQWFNKPFQSNGDNSAEEALLSEEENLLIINRLHQVLRPFVLRRLKHKVENELPEKIERLIRCEASAYQKLLMKRVEDNLGSLGNVKSRAVHNSVMELRNICNHPYLSQLHTEEVNSLIPEHYLPPVIRLCGKLEMLDRLLPKLKATDHRVLFFSTMTRLLDVMEDYLTFKGYKYLRLDGHTSGGDRGALIDGFNKSDSPYFIFLLSIRAGGVGVNLQAADTVIIFDTDWNPQVDLQAQARAHRIGQKRDVLVLRFETVNTVEEQVRASAEHKLGVANQSITAGFFDNNTSAEDRKEYLESLLRESKKEEAAPVLDDDALNDLIARRESEIDIFEYIDNQRKEDEMETWKSLVQGSGSKSFAPIPPIPSRLVTEDDLKLLYEAMKVNNVPMVAVESNVGMKRKGGSVGGLDTQHYGRGKRAREVRSYEEQLTEEEFEKLCQTESTDSPRGKEEGSEKSLANATSNILGGNTGETSLANDNVDILAGNTGEKSLENDKVDIVAGSSGNTMLPTSAALALTPQTVEPLQKLQQPLKEVTERVKRGRGRPKRADKTLNHLPVSVPGRTHATGDARSSAIIASHASLAHALTSPDASVPPGFQSLPASNSAPVPTRGRGRGRGRGGGAGRGRRVESMLHGADSSIGTQRTNALASLSDAKVLKPIKGSSSNLEPAPSVHSYTTAVQPSPAISLQESKQCINKPDVAADLDAPPGFGSGSHVQSLNVSEDSLEKKAAAGKDKPAVPNVRNNQGLGVLKQPVNIPSSSSTTLGRPPAQNQIAVSSVSGGSESPSIASVESGRQKNPEGQTSTASATMTITPLDANRPLTPHLVCSTVDAQGASVLSTPATTPVKRQGRKVPNRGETPRRRGRRYVQALPAADGSSARSTRSTPQIEVKIGDSLGSKIMSAGNKCDVVVQEQPHFSPSVSHSSASTSQEKRKETTGIGGSGRKQTTDVTDVARVMKEIFSETSLLKHKIGEPSETTVTNEPDGKSPEKMSMHMDKTSKAESITQPADQNLGVETFISNSSVEKQKSGSSVMIDGTIKTSPVIEASVSQPDDVTPQGTKLSDSKIPVGGEMVETELKVATSADPNVGSAASVPTNSEENKISDSSLLVSASSSQEKRKETAGTDVTDVTRVVKEIFSESSLLKHKVGDPSGTAVTNEPDGKSPEKMNMHMDETSKAESTIQPADQNLGVETFSSNFSVEKQKSGSSVMIDEIIKTSPDNEVSVSQSDDITPQGTMLIDSKIPVGGEVVETKLKVATSTDPNLIEVEGEKNDGDKRVTIPLIQVEQMNVHATVGFHERKTSSEEFQGSPRRTNEISHVDAINQTIKEVEAKSKKGESSEDQICNVGPTSAAIQSSMLHTDGQKTHTSNENSISLVHKDYGSPLSDFANKEQDSGESASIKGADSCKLGGEEQVETVGCEIADVSTGCLSESQVQLPSSEEQLGGTDFPSSLPVIEGEKADNPSDKRNMLDGEASGPTVSVQPEDLCMNLDETAEATQMEEDDNANNHSEEESMGQQEHLSSALSSEKENEESLPAEDPTVGGLGERESKDQREHLSSALSPEEETKAENPSDERNIIDGEAISKIVSAQPEDLSRNLGETEEATQMEEVGNASNHSEENVTVGVLGEIEESMGEEHLSSALSSEKENDESLPTEDPEVGVLREREESKDQREHLYSALSSEEETKAEKPSDERNMIDGEASSKTVSVQPEGLSRNLDETEVDTPMENVGNASNHSEENVTTSVLGEKEESKGQQDLLSSALSSENLTLREPKCSVSESDIKGDGKTCVGSSESADLDSEAPPETVNSIPAAIEASSEPSNSLVSEESKSEELKGLEDV